MQDTMLLDRRTKDLVLEYVPEGDVLDSIVCFFSIFADSTRVRMFRSRYFGNVRDGFITSARC